VVIPKINLSNKAVGSNFNKYLFLVLLVPLFFIAYPLFSIPGIPVGNGDLPYIEISLYSFKKFWTWNEFGSYHGLETLPRYPIMAAFQLINISPDFSSKLLIVGGFAIASFSFYVSSLKIFKNRINTENIKFKAAAVLGSLFYAYNVWSFHRIGHWYLWLGYAVLPMFIVSIIYAFRNPGKWKYILFCVLLWSVASSTPHMAVFFAIIFVALALLFIFQNGQNRSKLKAILLKPISVTIVAYVMINLYWIYPYLVSSTSESFLWSAVVTEEITRELSRESGFLNVLRLIEGTFNMGIIEVTPGQASSFFPLWFVVSLVPPVLAFSSVLFLKNKNKGLNKIILLFCALAIIGIFLTMGTNTPFGVYSALLFQTPLTAYLQILLREPDKWGFLVALSYSFLIVISFFKILEWLKSSSYKKPNIRNILSLCFILFVLFSFGVYVYPAYQDSMYNLYRPIVFPADFKSLNNNLSKFVINKVFLTPYSPGDTTWVKNIGTFDLYHVASPVPNIAASDYNSVEKYHKYLIDSIVTNKTSDVENIIYPLGTSYLIFHNDTLTAQTEKLQNMLASKAVGGSFINNFGFFNLFRFGDNQSNIKPVSVPVNHALVSGGLDSFASLNLLPTFSTRNSTLFFLDQKMRNDNDNLILNNSKYLFLSSNADDFILSFIDENQLLVPFEATNNHEPETRWSKAGTNDPGNAWFTPYIEDLNMQNSDFDYGKGLVITEETGSKLSMPFDIQDSGYHEVFMRFLKSQKGGAIRLYIDDRFLGDINTRNDISNANFEWQNIGSSTSSPVYLTKGKHTLTLENIAGFNAVNLFAIQNSEQRASLQEHAYALANNTKNIFILEAEADFQNYGGKVSDHTNWVTNQSGNNGVGVLGNMSNGSGTLLQTPPDDDLVSFFVFTNTSSYQPKMAIKMSKMNQTSEVFGSDFDEDNKRNILAENSEYERQLQPLASLRGTSQEEVHWFEEGEGDLSNITLSQQVQDSGLESLATNLKKGNRINWNIISTNFIGIDNGSKSIETGLDISARDVIRLHPKLVYYDENKTSIGSDIIFGGRNGTFTEKVTNVYNLPQGTEQLKLQFFANANPNKTSSYTLNDFSIFPLVSSGLVNTNDISNTYIDQVSPLSGNGSFRNDLNSPRNWNIISTDYIPVADSSYNNASFNIEARNVKQLHPKIIFYDENKDRIANLNNDEIEKILSAGQDGDFKKRYTSSFLAPIGTKYIKLELFALSNPGNSSSYWLDDIKVEEVNPDSRAILTYPLAWIKEEDGHTEGLEKPLDKLDDGIAVHRSNPIPVNTNAIYNYSIAFEDMNYSKQGFGLEGSREQGSSSTTSPMKTIAYFTNSSDVIQNSTKYGTRASGGNVLSLDRDSEIYADLEILKPANYTVALRIGDRDSVNRISNSSGPIMPEHDSPLTVEIRHKDESNELSTKEPKNKIVNNESISRPTSRIDTNNQNPKSTFEWIYLSNASLDRGNYEIVIRANEQLDLDSVIMYSVDDDEDQSLNEIFKPGNREVPANLTGFKKIDPTRYEVDIKNASKPFIMTFAESYDPLWTVYASKDNDLDEDNNNGISSPFRTNSVPMYSIVNGFYVNKTGDYTLTIEYQPQKWFEHAGIVSIISLITFVGIVLLQDKMAKLNRFRHR
jgi:hypothetical protein